VLKYYPCNFKVSKTIDLSENFILQKKIVVSVRDSHEDRLSGAEVNFIYFDPSIGEVKQNFLELKYIYFLRSYRL
jgi:hypothetical protein